MRRTVITGLGAVTPSATTSHDLGEPARRAAAAWTSSRSFRRRFAIPVNIAAEVKGFDPETVMPAKEVRKTNKDVHFGVGASLEALP